MQSTRDFSEEQHPMKRASAGSTGAANRHIVVTIASSMSNSSNFTINIPTNATVGELKNRCNLANFRLTHQIFVYDGKELKNDDAPISYYGMTADCMVRVMARMEAGMKNMAPTPSLAKIIFFAPFSLPEPTSKSMTNLRKTIRGLNTMGKQLGQTNVSSEQQSVSPKKNIEHILTRKRMKELFEKRRQRLGTSKGGHANSTPVNENKSFVKTSEIDKNKEELSAMTAKSFKKPLLLSYESLTDKSRAKKNQRSLSERRSAKELGSLNSSSSAKTAISSIDAGSNDKSNEINTAQSKSESDYDNSSGSSSNTSITPTDTSTASSLFGSIKGSLVTTPGTASGPGFSSLSISSLSTDSNSSSISSTFTVKSPTSSSSSRWSKMSGRSSLMDVGSVCGSVNTSPMDSVSRTPSTDAPFVLNNVKATGEIVASTENSLTKNSPTKEQCPVSKKELLSYFDVSETKQELTMVRRNIHDPPQNLEELQQVKKKMSALCGICRRRLPVAVRSIVCACGASFCNRHRDVHSCSVDYKHTERSQLEKLNPKIGDDGLRKGREVEEKK